MKMNFSALGQLFERGIREHASVLLLNPRIAYRFHASRQNEVELNEGNLHCAGSVRSEWELALRFQDYDHLTR